MKKAKVVMLALLLLPMLLCSGCLIVAAGAIGAGTVAYLDGTLKDSEPVNIMKVRAASLAAFKDLQYGVVGDEPGAITQKFSLRTSNDKKISVVLEKKADAVTEIRIHVGVFGDEELSHQLLDKIKARL